MFVKNHQRCKHPVALRVGYVSLLPKSNEMDFNKITQILAHVPQHVGLVNKETNSCAGMEVCFHQWWVRVPTQRGHEEGKGVLVEGREVEGSEGVTGWCVSHLLEARCCQCQKYCSQRQKGCFWETISQEKEPEIIMCRPHTMSDHMSIRKVTIPQSLFYARHP